MAQPAASRRRAAVMNKSRQRADESRHREVMHREKRLVVYPAVLGLEACAACKRPKLGYRVLVRVFGMYAFTGAKPKYVTAHRHLLRACAYEVHFDAPP